MICNKCGQENPDEAMNCLVCGHKLQSGWKQLRNGNGANGYAPIAMLREPGPASRKKIRKHVEAWTVAVIVLAAASGFAYLELYWPLFPLIGAAVIYAFSRGINWKDE
ncbi:MAG: zinc ribbon domain-containing protein [Desulfovibrio sp.]|jgi:uncharacterized membrane protein YvbJ|nr:zinc ribbon domain-containing protein [Desulfovibrio sp.]MBI4960969.1 zinc ribbon domain-containing protein [Desulfovibrio sp.]